MISARYFKQWFWYAAPSRCQEGDLMSYLGEEIYKRTRLRRFGYEVRGVLHQSQCLRSLEDPLYWSVYRTRQLLIFGGNRDRRGVRPQVARLRLLQWEFRGWSEWRQICNMPGANPAWYVRHFKIGGAEEKARLWK
jgi:hypothetical protein